MTRQSEDPHSGRPKARWLNRTIIGIGLASLFSDVGHEMATTAMPALLASMGASSAILGVIEGLSDGLSSFAKLFSGLYSDRLEKRKPIAVAGYTITALAMASFAIATQWWHVLLGRVGGWLGRGIRSPVRNALLAEATTPESYGRAYGLDRALDSAGAVIGPILALVLTTALGLRWTFALTLLPGCMAALLILFLVREKRHTPKSSRSLWRGVGELPGDFRRYLAGVGIAGIGDYSNTLLILWATQAWTPHYGVFHASRLAMAFYIGYNVIYTISCYVSGLLADSFPKHWVLGIGYSLAVIPSVALIIPGDSFLKFGVAFAFSGLYMGVWETLENTTAAALLPQAIRGTGFGLLATVNGIGDLVSSALVGILWTVSPTVAMSLVIIASLAGAGIIISTGAGATGVNGARSGGR